MTDTPIDVLTIGHSTWPYDHFLGLLRRYAVTAVADVRTAPCSRRFPQYNRDAIRDALRRDGIAYVFLGRELGGQPRDERLLCDGVADYEKMARLDDFENGLRRLMVGARHYRIAMMCAERDPIGCHRCLLIGRALAARGARVGHILPEGPIVTQAHIEQSLLALADGQTEDLFATPAEQLNDAYRRQARQVAAHSERRSANV